MTNSWEIVIGLLLLWWVVMISIVSVSIAIVVAIPVVSVVMVVVVILSSSEISALRLKSAGVFISLWVVV